MKNKIVSIFVLSFLFILPVLPQENIPIFERNGYAIGGYDPVAYFSERRPKRGQQQYQYNWQNAVWLFSSKANQEAFAANPEKFAPQYGGYCAYGMAQNYFAKTEPHAWSIVNDKLYLNYNPSIRSTWLRDTAGYIKTGNSNWTTLKHER